MTVSAPATSAFAMSPEYCRPPSAITGTPRLAGGERRLVDGGHLGHADTGDDAGGADGAGADADLDGVGTGVDERLRARAGGDVAADDVDAGEGAGRALRRRMMSSTPALSPLAVSTTITSTPASSSAVARCQASPKKPMAAPTRRRPSSSLVAFGYFSLLSKSLTVMRPRSWPCVVDEGQLLDLVLREDRDRRRRGRCRRGR